MSENNLAVIQPSREELWRKLQHVPLPSHYREDLSFAKAFTSSEYKELMEWRYELDRQNEQARQAEEDRRWKHEERMGMVMSFFFASLWAGLVSILWWLGGFNFDSRGIPAVGVFLAGLIGFFVILIKSWPERGEYGRRRRH